MPTTNLYSISGLKTWKSREGGGYQANLLRDGKVIGWFSNEGTGGMTEVQFCKYGTSPENKEERALFNKFLAELPDQEWPDEWVKDGESKFYRQDADGFLAGLVDDFENKKKLKRLCAKKTLFTFKGEDPDKDGWHVIARPYSPEMQKALEKNYGDKLGEVANVTRV